MGQKRKFGDLNDFAAKGSLKGMGEALDRGMVLVMSLWDDTKVNMLWLDAAWPADENRTKPGVLRGPCPGGATSTPEYLRANHPDAHVAFSQIKVGTIGSTFSADGRRMESKFVLAMLWALCFRAASAQHSFAQLTRGYAAGGGRG